MIKSVESIERTIEHLSQDSILQRRNKLGLCRVWTDRVLDLVKGLSCEGKELVAEAREVQIEPGLFHTFVKLKVGKKSYLWDGVGTANYSPYFGLEDQAPEHLKNGWSDIIDRINNYD